MTTQQIQVYIQNNRPKSCYLGKIEMQAMLDAAREYLKFDIQPKTEGDLPSLEYYGCSIYELTIQSHVGFSK